MATNIYDQAAESRLLDTYVPINFDLIYRAASTQQAQIDRTLSDLQGNVRRWSEFRSPSAADTENFYNLTIGALRGEIENMAANPDSMKTAAGRYALQSRINSLDYDSLANIQLSATNLQLRQALIADMQARGLYNASWDDIDISGWNTLEDGILNDLSPVQYMDYGQLTEPYTNLKDSYLGHRDPYSYFTGVSEDMVRDAIGNNIQDITRTPQAQLHMRDIERQLQQSGQPYTQADVQRIFTENAVQSQRQRVRQNIEYDRVGLTQLEYALRRDLELAKPTSRRRSGSSSGSGTDEDQSQYSPWEQAVASTNLGMMQRMQQSPTFSGILAESERNEIRQQEQLNNFRNQVQPLMTALEAAQTQGDTTLVTQINQDIAQLTDSLRTNVAESQNRVAEANRSAYRQELGRALGYQSEDFRLTEDNVNAQDFYRASSEILNSIAAPADWAKDRIAQSYPATKAVGGISAYQVPARDIVLATDLMWLMSEDPSENVNPEQEFINKWRQGTVNDLRVVPRNRAIVNYDRNGNPNVYMEVEVYMPQDDNMGRLSSNRFNKRADVRNKLNTSEPIEDADGKKYVRFTAYQPVNQSAWNNYQFDRERSGEFGGTVESRGDRDYNVEANFLR